MENVNQLRALGFDVTTIGSSAWGVAGIKDDDIIGRIKRFEPNGCVKWERQDLRAACILDTFSYECFKYECQMVQLKLKTWREQLEEINPHFLLVESAWRGEGGSWKRQLANSDRKPKKDLRNVVQYCKEKGIITVFWNKGILFIMKNSFKQPCSLITFLPQTQTA